MKARTQFLLVLTLAAAGLATGIATQRMFAEPTATNGNLSLVSGTRLPEPRPLPEFTLLDATNAPFTRAAFADQWTLLFFGFVNCPDVCPTTLATLASAVDTIAEQDVVPPQVVFISIDPGRDDPATAQTYAQHFNASFKAASGSEEALRVLTTYLGILHIAVDTGGGNYTMDHSTAILLIGPEKGLRAVFSAPHDADAIAADVLSLISDS